MIYFSFAIVCGTVFFLGFSLWISFRERRQDVKTFIDTLESSELRWNQEREMLFGRIKEIEDRWMSRSLAEFKSGPVFENLSNQARKLAGDDGGARSAYSEDLLT